MGNNTFLKILDLDSLLKIKPYRDNLYPYCAIINENNVVLKIDELYYTIYKNIIITDDYIMRVGDDIFLNGLILNSQKNNSLTHKNTLLPLLRDKKINKILKKI